MLELNDGLLKIVDRGLLLEASGKAEGGALLLHGMTATPLEMERLGAVFQQQNFRVSIPLFSGHGRSIAELKRTKAQSWYSDAEQALRNLATGLGEGKPLVTVGSSFGSLLSLHLAATFPEQISAVVALAPPFRLKSRFADYVMRFLSYAPDQLLDGLGVRPKRQRSQELFAVSHNHFNVHALGAAARLGQVRRGVLGVLHKVTCPVMILVDPEDHHIIVEGIWYLAGRLASREIRIEYLPGGQHELLVGHRGGDVHRMIEEFITTVR